MTTQEKIEELKAQIAALRDVQYLLYIRKSKSVEGAGRSTADLMRLLELNLVDSGGASGTHINQKGVDFIYDTLAGSAGVGVEWDFCDLDNVV